MQDHDMQPSDSYKDERQNFVLLYSVPNPDIFNEQLTQILFCATDYRGKINAASLTQ